MSAGQHFTKEEMMDSKNSKSQKRGSDKLQVEATIQRTNAANGDGSSLRGNTWGIDEAIFVAVGKVTVAFQNFEEKLGYTVWLLIGGDRRVAQCVTAEMGFDKLIWSIASLFKLRIEQCGERDSDLTEMLDKAMKRANDTRTARNQIIHSQWGFDTNFNLVIEKIEAKSKHGLRAVKRENSNPADLMAIVDTIAAADEALMDFCRHFAGVYHEAY